MIFELSCKPLRFYVIVQMGDYDAEAIRKWGVRHKYSKATFDALPATKLNNCAGMCWGSPDKGTAVIWLPEVPTTTYQHGCAVHELLHAVQHQMEVMGSGCSELQAYVLGNYWEEFLEKLNEIKKSESKETDQTE